ncbi:hypothetical protein [Halobellus limi]|jgi:hypothetical protein|uniref:Uncharacterized protein n=1 Tax=Halobellus limi TaxID=699433 RepID=A0A1H6BA38_9EURY|nr:hypothetical protein [Halobellus limi]SEG57414.1 hypothetical protein SAMN04488133_2681 [Halobellus limi]
MTQERDTVRLPLEPLRQRVAEATGRSASFVDVTDVTLDGETLEIDFSTPEEDVPVVEVTVESPGGSTDTTPVRLDTPSGLKIYGDLFRIEYAGRDAETDEILVSVARREGDEWRTVLGCGQMWAVEATRSGEPVSITCRAETPSAAEAEDEDPSTDSPTADEGSGDDEESTDSDGFLGKF